MIWDNIVSLKLILVSLLIHFIASSLGFSAFVKAGDEERDNWRESPSIAETEVRTEA